MNIEGIGDETAELLYRSGLIRTVADIYDLKPQQIASLPRMGVKSAENIMRQIDSSRSVPFERVLFALGIRFVGETTAKYLAHHFRSLEALMAASEEQLAEADEVGEKIAVSIREFFADERNVAIVNKLRAEGLQMEVAEKEALSDRLAGKSFVISGSFVHHSRDELKALIELHGGKNLAAVSGATDFLLAGDKIGPAKLQKATKLGVQIISESDFEEMLGGDVIVPHDAPLEVKSEESEKIPVQGALF
jgi:DNA ligase (NAD+)